MKGHGSSAMSAREPATESSPLIPRQPKRDFQDVQGPALQQLERAEGQYVRLKTFLERLRKFGTYPSLPKKRDVSREYSASWSARLFFTWCSHIVRTSNFRSLEMNDFDLVNPNRSAGRRSAILQQHLQTHVAKGSSKPLMRSLFATYRKEILLSSAASVLHLMTSCAYHFFTWAIVDYLKRCSQKNLIAARPTHSEGLLILAGLTVDLFVASMASIHASISISLIGGEMKALIRVVMLEKSFTISPGAQRFTATETPRRRITERCCQIVRQHPVRPRPVYYESQAWTDGAIMNAVNTEADRIQSAMEQFHNLYSFVIAAPMVACLGYWLAGWIGVGAVGCFLLQSPILFLLSQKPRKMRAAINVITEERVQLTQEIVNGVRFIKYFAWENYLLARLIKIRDREIAATSTLAIFNGVIQGTSCILGRLTSFCVVLYLAFSGQVHEAAITLPVLLLLDRSDWINTNAATAVPVWAACLGSFDIIESFLLAEDVVPKRPPGHAPNDMANDGQNTKLAISISRAQFRWPSRSLYQEASNDREASMPGWGPNNLLVSTQPSFRLHDISLAISPNELVAIFGKVASGKSSLLASLVGEMTCTDGSVQLHGTVSYCPQTPWIQSTTVRENILFGLPFDTELYQSVVRACCLDDDFVDLPNGDSTIMGELGINVSGGQKQRLALARALYQNRQIVLLDDPLSAVDAHTGEHIFQHAIQELCADRCRVLITHHRHLLPRCDRIVWLDKGMIRAIGTFSELAQRQDFTEALGQYCDDSDSIPRVIDDNRSNIQETNYGSEEIMILEERATDTVPWSLWRDFGRLCAPWLLVLAALFAVYISQVFNNLLPLQGAWWSDGTLSKSDSANALLLLGIVILHVLTWAGTFGGVQHLVLRGSSRLSCGAMNGILHAPVSFFDTTPLGRILNRFTGDINELDNNFPWQMWAFAIRILALTVLIPLVVTFMSISIPVFVPWFLFAAWIVYFYRTTPLEIKRLERICASRVTSRFSDGIVGRLSIKSARLESSFIHDLKTAIDDLNSVNFTSYACNGWMNTRACVVSLTMTFIIGLLVLYSRDRIEPAWGLLVIYYADDVADYCRSAIAIVAGVQRGMNAVERLKFYYDGMIVQGQSSSEPARHVSGIDPKWPQKGNIQFLNVHLRYRPSLPLALRGVNITIHHGERVGIVGRTGAGKSSILTCLLRICELAQGSIWIDGIDIVTVGLYDLRKRISVIPQHPTLFQGTIRSNLDPTGEVSDEILLGALRQVNLIEAGPHDHQYRVDSMHLDTLVEQSGVNFSTGQRQLISLARAMISESKIVFVDEATASVDHDTDLLIQDRIRTCFADCTVLTIAHRLHTVLSYDKICVLEQGSVCEYGRPIELWERRESTFRRLCDSSAINQADFRCS